MDNNSKMELNKPIKICIVSSRLSGGGAEHVARMNIECCLDNSNFKILLITSDKTAEIYNIPFCLLSDYRNEQSSLRQAWRSVYSHSNFLQTMHFLNEQRPDIIHLHDFLPYSPALINAVYQYKQLSDCKVLMTHHTYSYICTNDGLYDYTNDRICEDCIGTFDSTINKKNCANNKGKSCVKYLQKFRLKRRLFGLSDVHISPSEFLKSKLLQAFPVLDVCVIRNPCYNNDVALYSGVRNNDIVYFGRISREKGIVEFAKKFAAIDSRYTLHIIGTGQLGNELKQIRSPRIKITSRFLPTAELYEIINKSKFSVLPAVWYENSPVSIVESVAHGIVPIVSDWGGMKELVDLLGVGITFDPRTDDSVQAMLNQLDNYISVGSVHNLNLFNVDNYRQAITRLYITI